MQARTLRPLTLRQTRLQWNDCAPVPHVMFALATPRYYLDDRWSALVVVQSIGS